MVKDDEVRIADGQSSQQKLGYQNVVNLEKNKIVSEALNFFWFV